MTVQAIPVMKLGTGKNLRGIGRSLAGRSQVLSAYVTKRRFHWIVKDAAGLSKFLVTVRPRETWHRLLLLDTEASSPRRVLLQSYFHSILNPESLLSAQELAEVLSAPHPEDYFIGGVVNHDDNSVILYRGNFEPVIVPFAWFQTSPGQQAPDFRRFKVIDSGQTLALGEYEAASDAILFEFDEGARRRQKATALLQDSSLGASIRRLRLQKGLSRSSFKGISAKTIARIEQGQVSRPHQGTLSTIARRLGVTSDALGSF